MATGSRPLRRSRGFHISGLVFIPKTCSKELDLLQKNALERGLLLSLVRSGEEEQGRDATLEQKEGRCESGER
jgi:hypothetical protein